jgi:hypothetical protein
MFINVVVKFVIIVKKQVVNAIPIVDVVLKNVDVLNVNNVIELHVYVIKRCVLLVTM